MKKDRIVKLILIGILIIYFYFPVFIIEFYSGEISKYKLCAVCDFPLEIYYGLKMTESNILISLGIQTAIFLITLVFILLLYRLIKWAVSRLSGSKK